MTTIMDTVATIVHNETIQYLQEENVILNDEQIKFINEISLTLKDVCNMNIESDLGHFAEFCQQLNLSIGSKIKLKSAIIKLQEQKQQKLISSQNTSKLDVLISMGFDQQKAQIALTMNDNDITKAAQLLTAPQLQPLCNKDEKKDIEMDEAKVEDPNLQTLMAMGFNKQNSMIALELNRNDISKAIETLISGSISTFLSERTTSKKECKYVEKITVALIGDSGVGKSCILTRFMDDRFDEIAVETLGIDHREKAMNIIDTNIKLRVLDTAGQERFAAKNFRYCEVSAKSGRNINQLFTTVVLYVLRDNVVSKFKQNNKSKDVIHLITNQRYNANNNGDRSRISTDDLSGITVPLIPEDCTPSTHNYKNANVVKTF